MRYLRWFVAILVAMGSANPTYAQRLPGGFVFLRDVDPTIIQDIRYAGRNNFVGRPLAGYQAGECVVKRDVGLALKSIQQALAPHKLSLKMLDCYRPDRAVHERWCGRRTAGKPPPSGATIRRSARPICFGWVISPSIPAIPSVRQSISHWLI
jgi:D-alanyl-D-alanine dipeptidase